MGPLATSLRNDLERTVVSARETAEKAANTALVTLAVERNEPFPTMTEPQRALRRALRARARLLGGSDQAAGMPALIEEIAYQRWHRLLFARFLAENDLLRHPEYDAPVTLQDCADLAADEGAADAWELAARYAAAMLPGIFAADAPTAQVRLAPESRHALERLVQELPAAVYTSDDALGWVYQFWQTRRKAEVNRSEVKIGGGTLAPVTQLFTENYMVRFLLENSLGAWWVARHPESPLLAGYAYLRTDDDGAPAAGTFAGWPERAAEVRVMDPCCGSGHFLVAAFEMLWRMRREEEGLSAAEAGAAVLRDNLFGLEIDPRCTQIAAFSLLLAAWKAAGYRLLPTPQIACSGIPVEGQRDDWLKLANGSMKQRNALERLYQLFRQAPTLGSLIDPRHVPIEDRMFSADYEDVEPLFRRALERERNGDDPVARLVGETAQGVARAARLLAGEYTLVATNVPYLARGKQCDELKVYCDDRHPEARADLATAFVERCRAFGDAGGSYALVTPQNWTFLGSYTALRRTLLREQTWDCFSPVGTGAFETISGEVVNVCLPILSNAWPDEEHELVGIEADAGANPAEKEQLLRQGPLRIVAQAAQLQNPDARVSLQPAGRGRLLSEYADGLQGIASADYPRFGRCFWELLAVGNGWSFQQSSVVCTSPYHGREHVLFWQDGQGELAASRKARVQGLAALGKRGVAVSQMRNLPCTIYTGELFDNNTAVVLPKDPAHLPAIWAYCSSPEYARDVRRIDRSLKVTNAALVKVPFDLERWQRVADEQYPDGLPEPHSNDPTQWLFEGQPAGSTAPLQVAVARLLGYRWPKQDPDALDDLASVDGIVPLPPVGGDPPAAERLRELLAAAYEVSDASGEAWSPELQARLLADVGYGADGLADWLRDGFFAQHCKLFQNRPFLWHIWDGRKDGFGALVHYHRLDGPTLDKLIYTYLGRWIEAQRAENDRGVAGAEGRLVAALKLQEALVAIRQGEPPHDIYVRWKPLARQPIGWEPDLNDGVRLNIRPWVTAGVLRYKFTVHWRKDRGKDPDGGERHNDLHFTRAEKLAARRGEG